LKAAMPTYAINVDLKEITPIPRHSRLDKLMENVGFFPWRPSVPPEVQDEDSRFSQWEYAGNHSLSADPLKDLIKGRIKSEIQGGVDVTVLQVRIRAN
jgi:hypothetical protein